MRAKFPWLTAEGTVVAGEEARVTWWTFAGQKANACLGPAMAGVTHVQTMADDLAIEFERTLPLDAVQQAIEELRARNHATMLSDVSPEALEGMKFSACLPPAMAVHVLGMRSQDPAAVEQVLRAPVRLVNC
jgi:ATP-dependent Lhr-like helicase